jgi:hypothetical protein
VRIGRRITKGSVSQYCYTKYNKEIDLLKCELSIDRARKKKTVLRVSRITEDLDRLLQKDAEDKRMSVNALLTSIFTKYAEWDRYSERFGFISIGKELFSAILEAGDQQKLEKIGRDLGVELPKQFILFWFKKLNVETFLNYITLVSRYGGIAKCDIEVHGRDYTVSTLHDLGPKWSIFLRHFIDSGLRSTLGIVGEFHATKNSVVGRFTVS